LRQGIAVSQDLIDELKTAYEESPVIKNPEELAIETCKKLVVIKNVTEEYISWIKEERQQNWIQNQIKEIEEPTRSKTQEAKKKVIKDYSLFAHSLGCEGSKVVDLAIQSFSNEVAKIDDLQPGLEIDRLFQEWTNETSRLNLQKGIENEQNTLLLEQEERFREYSERYQSLGKKAYKEVLQEPYFSRFDGLYGKEVDLSDLASWSQSLREKFKSQCANSESIDPFLNDPQTKANLMEEARETALSIYEKHALVFGDELAKEGTLSDLVWEGRPERTTLDQINNAIELMKKLQEWRKEVSALAQNYNLNLNEPEIENAVHTVLLSSLNEQKLDELISSSASYFAGCVGEWKSAKENAALQEMFITISLKEKRNQEQKKEKTVVSFEQAKKELASR